MRSVNVLQGTKRPGVTLHFAGEMVVFYTSSQSPVPPSKVEELELKKDAALCFVGPLKIPHRLRLCIIKVLLPAQTKAKS